MVRARRVCVSRYENKRTWGLPDLCQLISNLSIIQASKPSQPRGDSEKCLFSTIIPAPLLETRNLQISALFYKSFVCRFATSPSRPDRPGSLKPAKCFCFGPRTTCNRSRTDSPGRRGGGAWLFLMPPTGRKLESDKSNHTHAPRIGSAIIKNHRIINHSSSIHPSTHPPTQSVPN